MHKTHMNIYSGNPWVWAVGLVGYDANKPLPKTLSSGVVFLDLVVDMEPDELCSCMIGVGLFDDDQGLLILMLTPRKGFKDYMMIQDATRCY